MPSTSNINNIGYIGTNILPITDPELDRLLADFCNSAPIKELKKKPITTEAPIVVEKVQGRNEQCKCDSGKKFKKCCGRK